MILKHRKVVTSEAFNPNFIDSLGRIQKFAKGGRSLPFPSFPFFLPFFSPSPPLPLRRSAP